MAPPAYDFWLLDLDGTLVDVEPAYKRELLSDVGDRLGVTFADSDVSRVWHGSTASRRGVLGAKGLSEREFWTAFDAVDDLDRRVEATFLYEDAAVVSSIDAPTGLVTHCPAPITERVLTYLDIEDWFDTVVCCDETVGWKPDPAPIRRAMAGLQVDGGSGVLAGDGPHDIGAAWNAGLDGIHVDRHDAALRGEYVFADHNVRSFTDLLA